MVVMYVCVCICVRRVLVQPTFSPSREGGVMHHSGSAGGGLRQVGTVTPPRSQSPAASDLGADDDEDRGGPDDVDAGACMCVCVCVCLCV